MMLTESHGLYPGHCNLGIRFFNLYMGTFAHVVQKSPRGVDGQLLLQRDEDTVIQVFHPFTGDIAEHPPLSTLPHSVRR
ncbi:hypothetical protein QYE76_059646 [Lolium multiflorum]|uniref:Uncharacterized protein n=1 Tax=Lolium multiflorum TaxID=4521 RepID=A0AAD8RXD9_LOLMU|nr:hypothetical protein QYE76_059646 [Lolium multiflorum]